MHSSACPPWPSDQPGPAGERGDYDAELHHAQGHDLGVTRRVAAGEAASCDTARSVTVIGDRRRSHRPR